MLNRKLIQDLVFMRRGHCRPSGLTTLLALLLTLLPVGLWGQDPEFLVSRSPVGRPGGRLVISLRAEPKTLLPLNALDASSKEIQGLLHADLIHIHRPSQETRPALAQHWSRSRDGKRYTLRMRRGLKFSDGQPLTIADVLFTFQVLLDEAVKAPGRDLLRVEGKFPTLRAVGEDSVEVALPAPYAPAERLFDSIAILPRHKLEAAYRSGKILEKWTMGAAASEIAGTGPFRLKEYLPGQRMVFERNPHYWKRDSAGVRLPYLNEVVMIFSPNPEAELLRFRAGESHLHSRLTARGYSSLSGLPPQERPLLQDLGPGLEQHFLFFNQNDLTGSGMSALLAKRSWLQDVRFRRAISLAIDRAGIARLVFQGKASVLSTHVSPGNRLWFSGASSLPARSVEEARRQLKAMGLILKGDVLVDPSGSPVSFTIAMNAANSEQRQMAAIIQEDLRGLGITVALAPLEFRSLIDRVLNTKDYEAAILALRDGDVDPTAQMPMLLSNGRMHFWRPNQAQPATEWEAEIDRLMKRQISDGNEKRRKENYAQVQRIISRELPFLALVSPHVLIAAHRNLRNVQPSVLAPHLIDGLDEMYWAAENNKP
jgi:peptide/nickel transport system substrate-binding protein